VLPESIPDFSVRPLIGLTVNAVLALLCLLTYSLFPRYKPIGRLFWVYIVVCVFFLGWTGQGYQLSDESVLFWDRFTLVGLSWLPFTCLYYLLALIDNKPGPVTWFTGVAALFLTAILVFVDHPAVLSLPLEPFVRAGIMRPQSHLVRPVVFFFALFSGLAWVGLVLRRRPGGSRPSSYAWLALPTMFIWLLGGLHDIAFELQLGPTLDHHVLWLVSILLSCCLILAVALRFRILDQALLRQTEELIHARNLATLGTIGAKVAHQVGGFLNKLVFAMAIVKAEKLSPGGLETIDTIERGSLQLSDFTRRFLSFARRPELDFQLLSLNEALSSAVDQCRTQLEAGRVEVTTSFDGKIQVVGDWSLLSQAFVNIITNALEAMNGQGCLQIRLRRLRSGWIRIDFEDNGSGMEERSQEEVWEPFFSHKQQGIGLGLPLVKNIVEAHGGRVSLRSQPRKGTTVILLLPYKPGLNGRGAYAG